MASNDHSGHEIGLFNQVSGGFGERTQEILKKYGFEERWARWGQYAVSHCVTCDVYMLKDHTWTLKGFITREEAEYLASPSKH